MKEYRVLVIGGYGFFGSRLVEMLGRQPNLHITVGGRSLDSAQRLVARVQAKSQSPLAANDFDIESPSFRETLHALRPDVVVHTAGPFQGQDYRVAQACIKVGAHYVDLADGRAFVQGIDSLDAAARHNGVLVTSGASSVPALSSAAADALTVGLARVTHIDIGISPGNRTERGLSTVRAILGYCGKSLPEQGARGAVGWRHTYTHDYPAPVGRRLLSPCDVPDLTLLGPRYTGTPPVRFGAGLELAFLHRGMNLMAMLAQANMVRNWADHAPALKRVADWFRHWGSDAGGMHVCVSGQDGAGQEVTRCWSLVATHGDGSYVPTLAAAALVRRLATALEPSTGATPCIGLLSLRDFQFEAEHLNITMKVEL
jgi:hypothetical protein